ncbi:MAG TPA: hypothetical protein VHQ47_16820 [Phycisphaerae bacterium]|jgi:hypothetical protein|nr:hypothetical protein [Phycisphaerae bacterium]
MTNVSRPLPSVEIAKLNVQTKREIEGMLLGVDALEHHLGMVHAMLQEPEPAGLSPALQALYKSGRKSVNEAVEAAQAKCAEARAALKKLATDIQH